MSTIMGMGMGMGTSMHTVIGIQTARITGTTTIRSVQVLLTRPTGPEFKPWHFPKVKLRNCPEVNGPFWPGTACMRVAMAF